MNLTYFAGNMAALIQRTAFQALQTFSKTASTVSFQEHLQQLKSLVHHITANDVNFDPSLVENQELYREEVSDTGERTAPVTYLNLFEDHVFTMGIFVLKKGVKLPLHDHPGMFGIIKVIHGAAFIRSYTEAKDRGVPEMISGEGFDLASQAQGQMYSVKPVQRHQPTIVTPQSPPCLLDSERANFHEIHAPDGPMAFLDILAPPYDLETGARECHYYKEFSLRSLSANSHTNSISDTFAGEGSEGDCYLMRIPQPREFWCDTAEYQGPEINPYLTDP